MSEQQPQSDQELAVNIQLEQAVIQFERWVNDSKQADLAYANGTLDQWVKNQLERELSELNKG